MRDIPFLEIDLLFLVTPNSRPYFWWKARFIKFTLKKQMKFERTELYPQLSQGAKK